MPMVRTARSKELERLVGRSVVGHLPVTRKALRLVLSDATNDKQTVETVAMFF